MKTDFFFTLSLTESEHGFFERILREECNKLKIPVVYYRKFKTGHEPMFRECKLLCAPHIGRKLLADLDAVYGNYHAENKE